MSQAPVPPESQNPRASLPDPMPRVPVPLPESEDVDLGEWLANLWEGRYIVLTSFLVFLALGAFMVWKSTPVYQIDAMLQVQAKKERVTDASFVKMDSLFSEPADAQAEIEILKSNLVLGRTAENLSLDIKASPDLLPIIGSALARHKAGAPTISVQTFEIPAALRGRKFKLIALGEGRFKWVGPDGQDLGSGRMGEQLTASLDNAGLQLKVREIQGKPGQTYTLTRSPLQATITELRLNFDAFEKGKMTSVLGLSYKSPSPAEGTQILNEIVNQYVRHKVEKKGGEAAKALALLQEKMPALKARLDEAESRLNSFRSHSGSVDLSREADDVLQRSSNLASLITGLRQKKEELLRTYKENADVVVTVNEQIRKLQTEATQNDAKARALPGTQQTAVRLSREVQVNQELYTALLNNIQQLQVTSAGDVGSYDLVDPATPNPDPVGPKPGMKVAIFGFLGFLAGIALARLRRVLRRGIKDHRIIEAKLGLPVVVTIPHSKAQEEHTQAIRRREDGLHIMAVMNPEDLATESLRSLRTVLHFSMKDAQSNVVMVTGSSPSIGKSFISSNLSVILAQTGARVLLVDGDLRKGNLHHYFGLKSRQSGLSDVLARRSSWESALHKTEIAGLDLLTTGIIPPNPSELLMSERFTEFLAEVSKLYTYVIIDAPPLLAVTDATIIGTRVGTVLLVAKYGQHPLDELRACQQRVEASGIHMMGCIFNDIQPSGLGYIGGNYQYSYHYTYKG